MGMPRRARHACGRAGWTAALQHYSALPCPELTSSLPRPLPPPPPADVLGKGYQRPLELATLRLFNMNLVLSHCECS